MNFLERVRVDTSFRDRLLEGLRVIVKGVEWVQSTLAPPQLALATGAWGGWGFQTHARRTPGPHVRRGGERDRGSSAADPLPAGRGRLCGGGGGRGPSPPGAGVVVGRAGPPPERVRARGGRRGGTEEGERECKRETLHWGRGHGLRLRCGREAGRGTGRRRKAGQPAAAVGGASAAG